MTFVNTKKRFLIGVKVYFPERATLYWDAGARYQILGIVLPI